jgi:2-polyprenyl-3-methyl-5-hydroxy-6-metoxy-1,4-benzoquinol methylase
MKRLFHRHCPNCNKDQPILQFSLRFDQFVKVNPTHNLAWFDSLGFAKDTKFDFVKCSDCGFIYSESRLNDKLNWEFYHDGIDAKKSLNKIYSINKKLKHISIWYNLLSLFSVHCNPDFDLLKNKLKILDFGAGWGDFLSTVKSPGIDVFGLEFDKRKIEFANCSGVSVGNFDFIKKNSPYNIFVCNQVLEHLDKPKESIRKLRNLLNKDAVGFISVPNFHLKRMDKIISDIKLGKSVRKEINPWGHLNYFTPDSLRQMIFESGFSEIQIPSALQPNNKIVKENEMNVSSVRKFFSYQYKAFSALFNRAESDKKSLNQNSTSLFIKINEI